MEWLLFALAVVVSLAALLSVIAARAGRAGGGVTVRILTAALLSLLFAVQLAATAAAVGRPVLVAATAGVVGVSVALLVLGAAHRQADTRQAAAVLIAVVGLAALGYALFVSTADWADLAALGILVAVPPFGIGLALMVVAVAVGRPGRTHHQGLR